jgi:hypothetical protein
MKKRQEVTARLKKVEAKIIDMPLSVNNLCNLEMRSYSDTCINVG